MRKFILIFIVLLSMPVKAEYVTSKDGLHLRSGPSVNTESLCVLPFGSQIEICGRVKGNDHEWVKTSYKGKYGYCAADYLGDDPGMVYMGDWRITAYAYTGSPCANGNFPSTGYTIACNSLPFGTEVYIDGVGIRTVEDRGPASMGSEWCDLYLGDTASCIQWGNQYRSVYLIE